MTDPTPSAALLRTPLHAVHVERGARMVPFAGYEMPVHYPDGILKEHLHTRAAAGLFDVSHMAQASLVAADGRFETAARALEALVPADILGLARGQVRYTQLLTDDGGIVDDLMVSRTDWLHPDGLLVVVNAARRDADFAHLAARLPESVALEASALGMLAVQGPEAIAALSRLGIDASGLRFMEAGVLPSGRIGGDRLYVARTGYTGEDGVEILCRREDTARLWRALADDEAVRPVGLGARDSLRLEAGLCLYGADIDTSTSPVEAGLAWSIQKVRRPGGARAGGYPGADRIARELASGAARRRVGLRTEGRAPVRQGAPLYQDEGASRPQGVVTSGGFGPSVGAPVAMGYLPAGLATPGTRVFAEVRGQRLPAVVAPLPFVPHTYVRR